MKTGTKAFVIAFGIETVLMILLVVALFNEVQDTAASSDLLGGYHFLAFLATILLFAWLHILIGGSTITVIAQFIIVFAVQVALTYPIVFFVLRLLERRSRRRMADAARRPQ